MKPLVKLVLVLAAISLTSATAPTQASAHEEPVEASFLLALGRRPAADELREWNALLTASVADLIARHRERLQREAREKRAVAVRACRDAFGRAAAEHEISARSAGGHTYTELMSQHVQWLAEHPDDQREVIDRAYRLVVHRAAYSIEFDYWRERGALPFVLLVGCIENWAQRNAPGLMSTTGVPSISVNSARLTTVRLSPSIAGEVRAAIRLSGISADPMRTELGCVVIAPGAESIVSVGGIHFVAVGSEALVPQAESGN